MVTSPKITEIHPDLIPLLFVGVLVEFILLYTNSDRADSGLGDSWQSLGCSWCQQQEGEWE